MKRYDVIISGAGPAGCAAALSLRNSGLRVALCEKEAFPREKICGDGLCDRTMNTLRAISETYYDELFKEIHPLAIKKAALFYKNKRRMLNFKSFGYTVSRVDFDHFLFTRVKRDCPNVEVYENCKITKVERMGEEIEVFSKNLSFRTKFLIFANGNHSNLTGNFAGTRRKKEDDGFAIRAYYKNIQGLQDDCIEMHYKKEYFPGYFWIFPLENGLANAGFGYHLKHAHQFNLPIKEIFQQWMDNELRERFLNAERVSPLKGGLIPYSKNEYECYGNNYVIAGDSAALADPISGGGIGNAMFSGREAALQAIRCFEENDFSARMAEQYSTVLKKRLQKEIGRRYRQQKLIANHRWFMDVGAFFVRGKRP